MQNAGFPGIYLESVKIRTKLILGVTGTVTAAYCAGVVSLFFVLRSQVGRQIRASQLEQVQMLGSVAERALARGDREQLSSYFELMRNAPGMDYAMIADSNGSIIAHTDREFAGLPMERWRESGRTVDTVRWEAPIQLGLGRGTIEAGFSREEARRAFIAAWKGTLGPLLGIALLGLGFAAAMGGALGLYISTAMNRIIKGSEAVSRGDYSATVSELSGDEIGELGRRFNEMIEDIRQRDMTRDEMTTAMSHDLKNPLGAMQEWSDLLRQGTFGPVSEKQARALTFMAESARRLSDSLSNVLDMAKMRAMRLTVDRRELSLEPIAERVLGLFRVSADAKKVSIKSEIAGDLPKLMADEYALDRILSNLVSNAIKFTEAGGEVVLRAFRRDSSVCIEVRDTGRGISEGDAHRLFQPFERLHKQVRTAKGIGLGLTIVKKLVEAQSGEIKVQSQQGKGTTFIVLLPIAK